MQLSLIHIQMCIRDSADAAARNHPADGRKLNQRLNLFLEFVQFTFKKLKMVFIHHFFCEWFGADCIYFLEPNFPNFVAKHSYLMKINFFPYQIQKRNRYMIQPFPFFWVLGIASLVPFVVNFWSDNLVIFFLSLIHIQMCIRDSVEAEESEVDPVQAAVARDPMFQHEATDDDEPADEIRDSKSA